MSVQRRLCRLERHEPPDEVIVRVVWRDDELLDEDREPDELVITWDGVVYRTRRGWRLAKTKRSNKIDLAVALGMSAWAAMQEQSQPFGVLAAF